jgi:hypothetical protein
MLRTLAVIALVSLSACGGNVLRDGGVKTQSGEGYSSPDPQELPHTAVPPPETPALQPDIPLVPVPSSAVVPVPVSGASLFCYREGSVNCLASDSKGSPLPFKPSKIYFSDSAAKIWIPTSFVSGVKASTWTVQVPETMQDTAVGILLLSEDNFYLANWLSPNPSAPTNLVKDGSFETLKIDPLNMESTRFITTSASSNWKARIPPTGNCMGILEQSSIDYSPILAAQHGDQWVQLTAPCEPGLGSQRNQVAISQVLNLKVAHHYELSFYYQAPLGPSRQTELAFTFGPNTNEYFTVTQNTWTLYKTVFTATQPQQLLEFTENGLVTNAGTALDSISIIEVGTPESRIVLEDPNLLIEDQAGTRQPTGHPEP